MLAIRMQRTGRRGHAQFRVVVQDSRFSPSSGRVVAYLGNYNPHTKAAALDGEKTSYYLDRGAQPSDRVVQLLKNEGIKLPKWVSTTQPKKREVRNPEKLRKNQPAQPAEAAVEEPAAEAPAEAPAEEPSVQEETAVAEEPVEKTDEKTSEKS